MMADPKWIHKVLKEAAQADELCKRLYDLSVRVLEEDQQ
jgi:hypothetical protein